MIVVDTKILVYRWLPDRRNEAAEALARIDPVWAAPALWRSEFRNVMSLYVRSGRLGIREAERIVDRAASVLIGGEHAVADRYVLDLAARSRRPAYDCEFAALAAVLGTVLVTEDRALAGSFPRLCRSLDDAVRTGLSS